MYRQEGKQWGLWASKYTYNKIHSEKFPLKNPSQNLTVSLLSQERSEFLSFSSDIPHVFLHRTL